MVCQLSHDRDPEVNPDSTYLRERTPPVKAGKGVRSFWMGVSPFWGNALLEWVPRWHQ